MARANTTVKAVTKKPTGRGKPKSGKTKGRQEATLNSELQVDTLEPEDASEEQAEAASSGSIVTPPGSFADLFAQLPMKFKDLSLSEYEQKLTPIFNLIADSSGPLRVGMIVRIGAWGYGRTQAEAEVKKILEAREAVVAAEAAARAASEAAVAAEAARLKAEEEEALRALDDRTPAAGYEFQAELERNPKTGAYVNSVHNALEVFAHDPRWAGVLAYDEFLEDNVFLKPPPWTESAKSPRL